jgi:hypothetical protein
MNRSLPLRSRHRDDARKQQLERAGPSVAPVGGEAA